VQPARRRGKGNKGDRKERKEVKEKMNQKINFKKYLETYKLWFLLRKDYIHARLCDVFKEIFDYIEKLEKEVVEK